MVKGVHPMQHLCKTEFYLATVKHLVDFNEFDLALVVLTAAADQIKDFQKMKRKITKRIGA